jgi:hypothetical protein
MTHIKSIRVAMAAAAMALLVAAAAHAWGFSHENKVKFSGPVALPGIVLPAGTYMFDVASPTAQDVVVVRGAESGKLFYMGFAKTVSRPRNVSPNLPIVLGEARANEVRPIVVWYEVNDTTGHEFLYR